jgi:hypothetical protein
MMRYFLFSVLAMACLSCKQKFSYHSLLNKDSLVVQKLVIDNNKDTVVHTLNGALLHFAKGSFSAQAYSLSYGKPIP